MSITPERRVEVLGKYYAQIIRAAEVACVVVDCPRCRAPVGKTCVVAHLDGDWGEDRKRPHKVRMHEFMSVAPRLSAELAHLLQEMAESGRKIYNNRNEEDA